MTSYPKRRIEVDPSHPPYLGPRAAREVAPQGHGNIPTVRIRWTHAAPLFARREVTRSESI